MRSNTENKKRTVGTKQNAKRETERERALLVESLVLLDAFAGNDKPVPSKEQNTTLLAQRLNTELKQHLYAVCMERQRLSPSPVLWRRDFIIDTVENYTFKGPDMYTLGFDGVCIVLKLARKPEAGKSRIKLDSDFGLPASDIEIVAADGKSERIITGWPKANRKTI